MDVSRNRTNSVIIPIERSNIQFKFDCTNNMTKYEVCIISLKAILELKVMTLEVFWYSLLIIF